ncbi:hypothetical protein [Thiolapillus sp.]
MLGIAADVDEIPLPAGAPGLAAPGPKRREVMIAAPLFSPERQGR